MVSLDLNRIRFASNQMQLNPAEFSPSAGENRQAWANPQGPSAQSAVAPVSQSATATDPFANLFTGASSFQNPFAMGDSDLSDTQRISAMAAMYGMQQPALPFTSMTAPAEAQAAQGIGAVSGGSVPLGPEALAKSLSVTGNQPDVAQGAQGIGQQLAKPEAATNSGGGQNQNAGAQASQEAGSSQEAQGGQGAKGSKGPQGAQNKQEQDEIDRLIQEAETLIKQAENETDPNAKYDLASQASQKLTEAQNKVSSMQKPSPPSQGNGANHGQQNRQQTASTQQSSGSSQTSAAPSQNSQSGANNTPAVAAASKAHPKPDTGDSPVLQQILALKQSVDSIRKDAMEELTPNSIVGSATQVKSAAGTNPADPTNDANPAKRLQPVANISV
jgi:hypothetical protein